jgi:starch-binding outer membrane protein, SusD/RagB family
MNTQPTAQCQNRGHMKHRVAASVILAGVALLGACEYTEVGYLNGPTSVANTPVGVQNAFTGLFSASRNDVVNYITFLSTFARDAANFVSTEPRYITEGTGIVPIPNTDQFLSSSVWDIEFRNARFANSIIAALPNVEPKYSADSLAALIGIAQTIKALNFMMLAETRDTLGVSVYSITASTPQPVYCNQDVWAYIVSLLDSANDQLNIAANAGAVPLPVILPPGFGSVSAVAGPSTALGSFASFNRALAGKAGLELAYAIARGTPGDAPDSTHPGVPDPTALTRADSAIRNSALYNPAALTTPAAGGYTYTDPYTVSHAWSPQSGDQVNPINGQIGTFAVLWDLVADVDTVHDARWKAKFGANTNGIQQPTYNGIASPYIYTYYPTTSSPTPIVRNEELVLVEAQILLGEGQLGNAVTLINQVHTLAGGMSSITVSPLTYTAVRDTLMKEQRISTAIDGSEDRVIAIRMYGLPTISDTTWNATEGPDAAAATAAMMVQGAFVDLHTTVLPPPATEPGGRGGNYTVTCPSVQATTRQRSSSPAPAAARLSARVR